ncbi:MAG: TetR family transcriptional regulator C-terminal domain-containing protein, partial [Dietzia sp.]|nr:TetR family transcriptional regulator C-terminal domain-containing protein [Dietzia sp.]
MWALLPVTPEQVEEEQVRLAFLVESRTDPELAELVAEDRAVLTDLMREAVIALRTIGELPASIEVDATVTEMAALLDGLAQAAALNPEDMPGYRIKATVVRWLNELPTR